MTWTKFVVTEWWNILIDKFDAKFKWLFIYVCNLNSIFQTFHLISYIFFQYRNIITESYLTQYNNLWDKYQTNLFTISHLVFQCFCCTCTAPWEYVGWNVFSISTIIKRLILSQVPLVHSHDFCDKFPYSFVCPFIWRIIKEGIYSCSLS